MNAVGQGLMNGLATGGALLRRATRIHQDNCAASTFRLAHTSLDELSPRGVGNALVHTTTVPVLQSLNVQVLKGQELKAVGRRAA